MNWKILLIIIPFLFSCASDQTIRQNAKLAADYFNLGTEYLEQEEYDQAFRLSIALSGSTQNMKTPILTGELLTGINTNTTQQSPITVGSLR
jgi:Tfp pilus assembly protein PilF